MIGAICPPCGVDIYMQPAASTSFLGVPQPNPAITPLLVMARVAVVLQCITVYPVLLFVIRAQFFTALVRKPYPGWLQVLVFNVVAIGITSAVVISGARTADVLPVTGGFSSLICVYTIPALVKWRHSASSGLWRYLELGGLLSLGVLIASVQILPSSLWS